MPRWILLAMPSITIYSLFSQYNMSIKIDFQQFFFYYDHLFYRDDKNINCHIIFKIWNAIPKFIHSHTL